MIEIHTKILESIMRDERHNYKISHKVLDAMDIYGDDIDMQLDIHITTETSKHVEDLLTSVKFVLY